MTAIKVVAASLALVCMYVTASQANNIYYPAPSYGWGPWSTWCACTKKCAGGEQWRTRKCLNPPYYAGPHKCDGAERQTKACNTYECPINGGYGNYGAYGKCSKTCGGGYQTCYRKCDNPAPQYGGKKCTGPKSITKACKPHPCPVDGGYGDYGAYSKCSKTCGGGYQTCYRKCNNPAPLYGGKYCSGPKSMTKACKTHPCAINGGYGAYGAYSKCTKTCGGGYQTCYRKCDSPAPLYGGKYCSGPKSMTKACKQHPCPINGGYGNYGAYSKCSKTCGGGYQTCYRKCNNPAPLYGGKYCSGPKSMTKACKPHPCPVNGGYGKYGAYGKCTKTCGGGYQTCYRKCDSPAPLYGGKYCSGQKSMTKACNTQCCKVNGGYGAWSAWTPCSITCKVTNYEVGFQKRTRKCCKPYPKCGGKCVGPAQETKKCTPNATCPYVQPPPAY